MLAGRVRQLGVVWRRELVLGHFKYLVNSKEQFTRETMTFILQAVFCFCLTESAPKSMGLAVPD